MIFTHGERFVGALSSKDAGQLKSLLGPNIDFKALTPGRFWESDDVDVLVGDILLGQWFEPTDRITDVLSVENDRIGSRERVGYRLAITNADDESSSRRESHPPALSEPNVSLSTHSALAGRLVVEESNGQCAKRLGSCCRAAFNQSHALRGFLLNRLNFRIAHRTRCWSMRLARKYNSER